VKFWVGVTDKDWFDYLSAINAEEVNFWQPSGKPPTTQLQPGDLFLFKLHSPNNYIVGGGFYVRFSRLPTRIAWEAFEQKNGVISYSELVSRIEYYKKKPLVGDVEIGCNILNTPFYFSKDEWIPVPSDWAPNIVRGKFYDTQESLGMNLYEEVQKRLQQHHLQDIAEPNSLQYGNLYLTKARLGQGAFRVLVTDAYHRSCAVTNEKTLPALEAAHIRPHAKEGPNKVSNGLLLRADIHRLFDSGYVTLDHEYKFIVSNRVKEVFLNGREYYRYHGNSLVNLPELIKDRPTKEFIDWHNQEIFVD